MKYIYSLSELSQSDLLLAGGKAANLGVLIRAGLPVPPGFCITTDAYRAFVAANDLQALILRADPFRKGGRSAVAGNRLHADPRSVYGGSDTRRSHHGNSVGL